MLQLIDAALLAVAAGISAEAPPPAPKPGPTLRFEAAAGLDGPLGTFGVAGVVTPRDWLSVGLGVGVVEKKAGVALFGRAHLLRVGRLAIGPAVAFSLGHHETAATYQRPQYTTDHFTWSWDPAYRLSAGLGAEVRLGSWRVRAEGGVGYVLNDPSCHYTTEVIDFSGDCDAPQIPAYYHLARTPGHWGPYVALSVGPEFDLASVARVATGAGGPPPSVVFVVPSIPVVEHPRWYGGPAVMSDLAAVGFVAFGGSSEVPDVLAGVTYALGSPINHLVRRHPGRAMASLGIRLAAAAVGTIVLVSSIPSCFGEETGGQRSCDQLVLIPIALLGAMVIDDAVLSRDMVADSAPPAAPGPTVIPSVSLGIGGGALSLRGTF